uniref:Uncharacterized protein n=1 Tax=Anopheles atroparvus TaxID=41427 RepID=A0A182IVP5_ANOAO
MRLRTGAGRSTYDNEGTGGADWSSGAPLMASPSEQISMLSSNCRGRFADVERGYDDSANGVGNGVPFCFVSFDSAKDEFTNDASAAGRISAPDGEASADPVDDPSDPAADALCVFTSGALGKTEREADDEFSSEPGDVWEGRFADAFTVRQVWVTSDRSDPDDIAENEFDGALTAPKNVRFLPAGAICVLAGGLGYSIVVVLSEWDAGKSCLTPSVHDTKPPKPTVADGFA